MTLSELFTALAPAAGLIVLFASFSAARRIHREAGSHGRSWLLVRLLIAGFILGYVAFALHLQGRPPDSAELVAALLFLFGAFFVRLVLGLVEDTLREMKRMSALQVHAATHDQLTGLWNRSEFLRRADRVLATLPDHGHEQGAMVVFDLVRFRALNQSLGHYHGDLILKEVARRLRRVLGDHHLIGRVGGDKFAVLLEKHNSRQRIPLTVQRLIEVLGAPYPLEARRRVDLGVHAGMASFPDHARTAERLLRQADCAARAATSETAVSVFDPASELRDEYRLSLLADLRAAVSGREGLVLQYQPQVDMARGVACSAEALLRWQHPRHGLLGPDEFVGLAEEAGIIDSLTWWVLEHAFAQLAEWQREGVRLRLAINLSAGNLLNADLLGQILELRRVHDLPAELVKFEITESAVMEDPDRAMDIVSRLHDAGFLFSIDDFGTGYSSLAYLKRLPVHEIKIDKSFVMDMTRDDNDAVIVRSTIDLAHNMGRRVVAEGVETQEVLDLLRILGCDCVQGFHISRPLAPDVLRHWLVSSAFRVERLVLSRTADRSSGT